MQELNIYVCDETQREFSEEIKHCNLELLSWTLADQTNPSAAQPWQTDPINFYALSYQIHVAEKLWVDGEKEVDETKIKCYLRFRVNFK